MRILRWALIWMRQRYVSYFCANLNFWCWFSLYGRYSLYQWITLCPLYFIITHAVTWRLGQCCQYNYSLQAGWFGVWTVVGARDLPFPTPVQTGPCVCSGSCMMGTGARSRDNVMGCGSDHPLSSRSEIRNETSYTSSSVCACMACYRETIRIVCLLERASSW
jgi:hypothetical protein